MTFDNTSSVKIQDIVLKIMELWQRLFILFWGIISIFIFVKGFQKSRKNNGAFTLTPILTPYGIFVWGDAVVFGVFWTLVSITVLLLNDWILFLLITCVFWVVRSMGETIYWLNQQFSVVKRNPPEKLLFYKYFRDDSVWFIHQIFWQCITIISVIFAIYFAKLWI